MNPEKQHSEPASYLDLMGVEPVIGAGEPTIEAIPDLEAETIAPETIEAQHEERREQDQAAAEEVRERLHVNADHLVAPVPKTISSSENRTSEAVEEKKLAFLKEISQRGNEFHTFASNKKAIDEGMPVQDVAKRALAWEKIRDTHRRQNTTKGLVGTALAGGAGTVYGIAAGSALAGPIGWGFLGATVVGIPVVRRIQKYLHSRKEEKHAKKYEEVFARA
ncbi:MAG: hypothetical protein JWN90_233 [Parcubacteria group bacterium]|nr:hypothetical protein [Parcubacteria group bacterium]